MSGEPTHMERIVSQAEEVLQRARPFLHEDGGDVAVLRFESGNATLVVQFSGNCATCPLSMFTLRAGLEPLVRMHIPEVHRLEIGVS